MSKPRVSVIIPAYNCGQYVSDALDSVLAQTYKDYEVIVIDDGSKDNTAAVVSQYVQKHGIKYIYQENKGPSAARNTGIQQAQGDLIAFLDADDIWMPEKLSLQVTLFEREPVYKMIYTNYVKEENGEVTNNNIVYEQYSIKKLKREMFVRNCLITPTILIKKECFDEAGFFDESLAVAEDWDMWLRICEKYTIGYVDAPMVRVRKKEGSQSYYGQKNLENELRFLKKLYSKEHLKGKWILKSKAYSHRYSRAAWAFHSAGGDRKTALNLIIKSIALNPIYFFSSHITVGLLFRIAGGERLFMLVKRFKGTL